MKASVILALGILSMSLWKPIGLFQTNLKIAYTFCDAASQVSGIYQINQITISSDDKPEKSVTLAKNPLSDSLSGTMTLTRKSANVVTLQLAEYKNNVNVLSLAFGEGKLEKSNDGYAIYLSNITKIGTVDGTSLAIEVSKIDSQTGTKSRSLFECKRLK